MARPALRPRPLVVLLGALLGAAPLLALGCPARPRPFTSVNPTNVFRMPERARCEGAMAAAVVEGELGEEELLEVSGVVASPSRPGVLWMHNDAGDEARVFAVTVHGAALGALALPGVEAVDFEDIAAGPCPDLLAPCIYVADTGDNDHEREQIVVYAFAEPDVAIDRPLPAEAQAERLWRFPFTIAEADGGPVNVEAFVVLPDASAMVFFEKAADVARILRAAAPWQIDTSVPLEVTAHFAPPRSDAGGPDTDGRAVVTGADVHPSGQRLLLRTYLGVFEARLDPQAGRTADRVEQGDFVELFANPDEPQGEAIGYDEAGTGVWTISESVDGTPRQPLHHASCDVEAS